MFGQKRKTPNPDYDKTGKKAVLKCSICNGERVAGFKDIHTGRFEEIMFIKTDRDLDEFMELYDVETIEKEY